MSRIRTNIIQIRKKYWDWESCRKYWKSYFVTRDVITEKSAPLSWDRVKVSENLGATSVAPVDTSLNFTYHCSSFAYLLVLIFWKRQIRSTAVYTLYTSNKGQCWVDWNHTKIFPIIISIFGNWFCRKNVFFQGW